MRTFLVLTIFICMALLSLDQLAFDGSYSRSAWQEAKYQGKNFNDQFGRWFKKVGLK